MAMMMIMLFTVHYLSAAAIEYDIKNDLRQDVNKMTDYVYIKDGKLNIEDEFWYQQDSIFLIVRKDGSVAAGEYPKDEEGSLRDVKVPERLTVSVDFGSERYYVRDTKVRGTKEERLFLRGVLKKSDADSHYETITMASYLNILGVLLIVLAWGLFYSRRISKELEDMCRTAESIGTSLDITKRMKGNYKFQEVEVLAQANNRMLDQIEQNFKQQEQFASDVAHELRTPIAVILAQCQYAEARKIGAEEYGEILDVVFRQSKKIDRLIIQLLHLSRLEQGRMQIQEETLDLVEIVQSVCEEQQEKLKNGVSVRLELNEAFSTGDIGLIAIVIQNLLTNAAKFSRVNGRIDVRTGEVRGEAFVEVRDYGIGIEKENQKRIFQRFYKCDKSRNAEGFGLGLSLSKKIAEKHDGRIEVESEPEKGSVCTLYLPSGKI